MRFRTIGKALDEIKGLDPNTCLSEFVIRKLARENKISQVKSGNKTLVDLDSLIAFLNGEDVQGKCTELPS